MGIQDDAIAILRLVGTFAKSPDDPKAGRHSVEGHEIAERLPMDPDRINEAVALLGSSGLAKVVHSGTVNPYDFVLLQLTPRGRVQLENLPTETLPGESNQRDDTTAARVQSRPEIALTPAGSPYGFTDQDWARVAVDRQDRQRLVVSFGLAWQSTSYNPSTLEANIRMMFTLAVESLGQRRSEPLALDFRKLQGGYGGHLFNLIARDIIASDIAVFDTSDLNPNVMVELGVALTWGTSILPIRNRGTPIPPSDLSGHTWVEYSDSGAVWHEAQHAHKLEAMLSAALDRKRGFAA